MWTVIQSDAWAALENMMAPLTDDSCWLLQTAWCLLPESRSASFFSYSLSKRGTERWAWYMIVLPGSRFRKSLCKSSTDLWYIYLAFHLLYRHYSTQGQTDLLQQASAMPKCSLKSPFSSASAQWKSMVQPLTQLQGISSTCCPFLAFYWLEVFCSSNSD